MTGRTDDVSLITSVHHVVGLKFMKEEPAKNANRDATREREIFKQSRWTCVSVPKTSFAIVPGYFIQSSKLIASYLQSVTKEMCQVTV